MSVNFDFDAQALQREMKRQAQDAIDEMARDMTQAMERLRAQYAGRPVAEIKPALRDLFNRDGGGDITDPELTEYAEAISAGTRIEFEADNIWR